MCNLSSQSALFTITASVPPCKCQELLKDTLNTRNIVGDVYRRQQLARLVLAGWVANLAVPPPIRTIGFKPHFCVERMIWQTTGVGSSLSHQTRYTRPIRPTQPVRPTHQSRSLDGRNLVLSPLAGNRIWRTHDIHRLHA